MASALPQHRTQGTPHGQGGGGRLSLGATLALRCRRLRVSEDRGPVDVTVALRDEERHLV